MKALGFALLALIRVLAGLLAFLVALGVLMIGIFSWSGSNAQQTSYECVVRRMDHHIAESSTGAYHDTCMAAAGYRRRSVCTSNNFVADSGLCYAPRWQFWSK